jgi:hypothetical protein
VLSASYLVHLCTVTRFVSGHFFLVPAVPSNLSFPISLCIPTIYSLFEQTFISSFLCLSIGTNKANANIGVCAFEWHETGVQEFWAQFVWPIHIGTKELSVIFLF